MKTMNLALLFVIIFSSYVYAQPELDTTLNSSGRIHFNLNVGSITQDVVVQPDNKPILLGNCMSMIGQSVPFCLIRLNNDGSFDSTFGSTSGGPGQVYTTISGGTPSSLSKPSLALQADGKILAAHSVSILGDKKLYLVRYNSDGNLDTTFGNNGIVQASITNIAESQEVLVQPDGKILIVGFSGSFSDSKQFVTRYLPNGTLDTSFGTNGVTILEIKGFISSGLSIALQADGKIVTGGFLQTSDGSPNPTSYYLVARYHSDGSIDTSFDDDGYKNIVGTVLSSTDGIQTVAIQADGKILALGIRNILFRFKPDGSLDTSFDGNGSRSALNGTSDAYDLVVTPSGKISVVGIPTIGSPTYNYRVARYLSNGSPDTTFSDDGFLDIDVGSGADGATSAKFDQNGKLVMGGKQGFGHSSTPFSPASFSIARLIAPVAQNVSFKGRVTDSNGRGVYNAQLILKNGSTIIAYARTNPFGYFNFANITSAQTYTLSTFSKNMNFYDRNVLVDDAIENYEIVEN